MKQRTSLWIGMCLCVAALLPSAALAAKKKKNAAADAAADVQGAAADTAAAAETGAAATADAASDAAAATGAAADDAAQATDQAAQDAAGAADASADGMDPNALPPEDGAMEEVTAGAWPITYAQRPLVLNEGLLRIDVGPADFALLEYSRGLTITKNEGFSDAFVGIGIGAAYGVMRNLEVGAVLLPIGLSPDFNYGDISAYGRYRFVEGDTEVGVQADVWIPTDTDFGIAGGVPVLFHLSPMARLDTGARVRFTFADDTRTGLEIPLAFNYNVTPTVFLGARTGLDWVDLSESASVGIPLGVQGGVNLMEGKLDLTAWFRLPRFIAPDAPAGADTVQLKTWQVGIGANFFLDTKRAM